MNTVLDQLDEIYSFHYLCMNIDHGIKYHLTHWEPFIPSIYVYSFYTFNTICFFDWSSTFKKMHLTEWMYYECSNSEQKYSIEIKKIYGYIDFLYHFLRIDLSELFHQRIRDNSQTIQYYFNEIEDIIIDQRLSESFHKNFSLIWNKTVKGKVHKESLKKIIFFIYHMKNYIFNRENHTIQLMDQKKNTRLKIAASILSSLNDLLFIVAQRELGWDHPDLKIGNRIIHCRVEWEKVLVWGGFLFEKSGNSYSLIEENEENRRYLSKILNEIGFGNYFDGMIFKPKTSKVNKQAWLDVVEKLHMVAEMGRYDQLEIMDAYMGGIVRYLNIFGFSTEQSCDGHGKRNNFIILKNKSQSYLLDVCIRLISEGQYAYKKSSIIRTKISRRRPNSVNNKDRDYLLNIAELLKENRSIIKQIILNQNF